MTDKPKEKKEIPTRVYPIADEKGETRYVKAPNLAAAIVFIYQPKCGQPLSATEVVRVYEEGHKVETASA